MNKELTFEELYKHKIIKDICKKIAIFKLECLLLKHKGVWCNNYSEFCKTYKKEIKDFEKGLCRYYRTCIDQFFIDCKNFMDLDKELVLRLI